MGIEEIKAPRRPARGSLIDALTAREAFRAVCGGRPQQWLLLWARSLARAQLNSRVEMSDLGKGKPE
jgi:hypothetical protein